MQFAPHSLPSRTLPSVFWPRTSLPPLPEVGGAAASPPELRSSGDDFLQDDLSDDELEFPEFTQPWARATTCPGRVTQADEDLMFAFDEDFHEDAERAAEGSDDELGVSSEDLRSRSAALSGLFFLND